MSKETRRPELSCDLGEATNPEERAVEARLWPLVDAANVACGGHVGDDDSMRTAVRASVTHGVTLGAHPSFPDREGFGRREISIEPHELSRSLEEQIRSLQRIATEEGTVVRRVKPHGALYNRAHADEELARLVVSAVRRVGKLALVASPGSALLAAGEAEGLDVVAEAFGDRRYRRDGSLVPRSDPAALLLDFDEAASQVEKLVTEGRVTAIDGTEIAMAFDTICVHGDMPGAAERLQAIRARVGTR